MGGFLFFPAVCGLLSIIIPGKIFKDILPGGALGELVKGMDFYFGSPGTCFILFTFLLVSLILLTRNLIMGHEIEDDLPQKGRNKEKKPAGKSAEKSLKKSKQKGKQTPSTEDALH